MIRHDQDYSIVHTGDGYCGGVNNIPIAPRSKTVQQQSLTFGLTQLVQVGECSMSSSTFLDENFRAGTLLDINNMAPPKYYTW